MTRKKIYNSILEAIDVFDLGKVHDARKIMQILFEDGSLKAVDQELYDLAMEFYIYICDGDLRKEGRDFGFSNTSEIRQALEKLKV